MLRNGADLGALDLSAAAQYHAERKRRKLLHPAGPAAPLSYRAIYAVAGFTIAEDLPDGCGSGRRALSWHSVTMTRPAIAVAHNRGWKVPSYRTRFSRVKAALDCS